jgi:hypothetical protein
VAVPGLGKPAQAASLWTAPLGDHPGWTGMVHGVVTAAGLELKETAQHDKNPARTGALGAILSWDLDGAPSGTSADLSASADWLDQPNPAAHDWVSSLGTRVAEPYSVIKRPGRTG